MAFKIKCEGCGGRIHKVWDTLSIFINQIPNQAFQLPSLEKKENKRMQNPNS